MDIIRPVLIKKAAEKLTHLYLLSPMYRYPPKGRPLQKYRTLHFTPYTVTPV